MSSHGHRLSSADGEKTPGNSLFALKGNPRHSHGARVHKNDGWPRFGSTALWKVSLSYILHASHWFTDRMRSLSAARYFREAFGWADPIHVYSSLETSRFDSAFSQTPYNFPSMQDTQSVVYTVLATLVAAYVLKWLSNPVR